MARVEAIWIKRMKRGPMDAADEARLEAGHGIVGNADVGGRRQVTLVEAEVFERVAGELRRPVDPSWRRANVMVRGLPLEGSRGRVLRIGDASIEIVGETAPCHRMDEACPGLQEALRPGWGGGAYGIVREPGRIRVSDPVGWEPPERGENVSASEDATTR